MGPRASFARKAISGGSSCHSGLRSRRAPCAARRRCRASWRRTTAGSSRRLGQSTCSPPGSAKPSGRTSRPVPLSRPMIASGSCRAVVDGRTAKGSSKSARSSCGPAFGRASASSVAASAKPSSKIGRSAPGIARSSTTWSGPASSTPVMVGPTCRDAGGWSSSATAWTARGQSWPTAIASPLAENAWPSIRDSGSPRSRACIRISVEPSDPAASTTRRAITSKGVPCRSRSSSSVCCTATRQPAPGTASSPSTLAPQTSSAPCRQACSSSPVSSDSLAS